MIPVLLVGLGFTLGLIVRPGGKEPKAPPLSVAWWIAFVDRYRHVATSEREHTVLARIIEDAYSFSRTGVVPLVRPFPEPVEVPAHAAGAPTEHPLTASPRAGGVDLPATPPSARAEATAPADLVDGTSLLLGFGTFLFVSAAGLFVMLGGASGAMRTSVAAGVTAVLYGGGIWLFRAKPKLRPAALSFVATGMITAPLVGLAAYDFVLGREQGPLAWLMTSAVCAGLYAHALLRTRNPLISYVLIFTFVSVFESSVSVLDAPVYGFGWAMSLAGLLLVAGSHHRGIWPELRQSTEQSAHVLAPLSVLASVALVPDHGSGPLGVSLLLGAAFYGLAAWLEPDSVARRVHCVLTHTLVLAGIGCLVLAATDRPVAAIGTLIGLNLVQTLVGLARGGSDQRWTDAANVVGVSSLTAVALSVPHPTQVLVAAAALVVTGLVVAARQERAEAYGVAALAWATLPFLALLWLGEVRLPAEALASLMGLGLLGHFGAYLTLGRRSNDPAWHTTSTTVYLVHVAAVAAVAWASTSPVGLLTVLVAVGTLVTLREIDGSDLWVVAAGVLVATAGLQGGVVQPTAAINTVLAVVLLVALAARYHLEALRWLVTGVWLAVPMAVGTLPSQGWSRAEYTWAYLVAGVGLAAMRAVALRTSGDQAKDTDVGLRHRPSLAYVAGYTTGGATALTLSVTTGDIAVHTSLVLVVLMAAVVLLGRVVERQPAMLSILPIASQLLVLALCSPVRSADARETALFGSVLIAFVWFAGAHLILAQNRTSATGLVRRAALFTCYVAPAGFVLVGSSMWPMPLGLLLAGAATYLSLRDGTQTQRETSVAVGVAAGMWFLALAGVTDVQVHTHVAALTMASFAWWRYARDEAVAGDGYVFAALVTSTFPLALQALSTGSGDTAALLLAEQVGFLVIGILVRKSVISWWGLTVAVAVVLYELRNLGWVILTIAAVVVVAIAIARLQTTKEDSPTGGG